jgi:hypothetical protein
MHGEALTKQYLEKLTLANAAPWNRQAKTFATKEGVTLLETSLHSLTYLLAALPGLELEDKTKAAASERALRLIAHLNDKTLPRVNEVIGILAPTKGDQAKAWAMTLALGLAEPQQQKALQEPVSP